jgi:RimJ/RimL family protein N-acetyltransferase
MKPRKYKCLKIGRYKHDGFKMVPVRFMDRYLIMKWRNEQMHHLRQKSELTKAEQDHYFENVIAKLFTEESPTQILFSFLDNNKCIGYGGLVHINWTDKNAEFSFLLKTNLIQSQEKIYWSNFLKYLCSVAFEELGLHKVYGYAYDVRPHIYNYLLESRFKFEARLTDHYYLGGKFYDVVIHSIFNENLLCKE